jgi:hypothetical protein
LPDIKNTRHRVSKPVFLSSVSQNGRSSFAGFQTRRKVSCLFSLIEICDAFFDVTKLAGTFILAILMGRHGGSEPEE